ncbi:hypothetical protein C1645_775692 [Glomus cerebriforme]|uniref:Uncharacterized protein n=1 Tax=Glomus cerebriforme TaxID=658196 RepID=A0A397STD3_9GLOM|nr:hypothetical protein C1645_775692 [Glomus cerebriforme]
METNVRTNAERETIARLDELVSSLSPPSEDPSYSLYNIASLEITSNSYSNVDMNDDADMEEVVDDIFALPQFSRFNYITDHGNNSFISPPLSDDEENQRDMLEDFNNRDKKVQELILQNKRYFEKIKQSFNSSEEEWKRFLRVLYAKSEIVPNREWINTICEFINPTNPLLLKFKELISNNLQVENTDDNVIDLYGAAPYQTSEIDDDAYFPSYNSTAISSRRESRDDNFMQDVDIKVIRNYPEKLADFESAYPDFFMNARTCFGQGCRRLVNHLQESNGNTYNFNGDSFDSIPEYGEYYNNGDYCEEGLRTKVEEHRQACEDSELYERFVQIFFTPRRMMPDDLWEEAIYECLNDWPHLMVQLKDIIVFEVSNENNNEVLGE